MSTYSGSCFEIVRLLEDGIGVRDTKDKGSEPVLIFSLREWNAFLRARSQNSALFEPESERKDETVMTFSKKGWHVLSHRQSHQHMPSDGSTPVHSRSITTNTQPIGMQADPHINAREPWDTWGTTVRCLILRLAQAAPPALVIWMYIHH
jgi:Domain of unknown function (DUF397)